MILHWFCSAVEVSTTWRRRRAQWLVPVGGGKVSASGGAALSLHHAGLPAAPKKKHEPTRATGTGQARPGKSTLLADGERHREKASVSPPTFWVSSSSAAPTGAVSGWLPPLPFLCLSVCQRARPSNARPLFYWDLPRCPTRLPPVTSTEAFFFIFIVLFYSFIFFFSSQSPCTPPSPLSQNPIAL